MSGTEDSAPEISLRRRTPRIPSRRDQAPIEDEPIPYTMNIAAQSRRVSPIITLAFYFFLLQYIIAMMPSMSSMPSIWNSNTSTNMSIVNESVPKLPALKNQTVINESVSVKQVSEQPVIVQNEPIKDIIEKSINETVTLNSSTENVTSNLTGQPSNNTSV